VKKRASANYFWIGNSLQEKSRFYVSLATFFLAENIGTFANMTELLNQQNCKTDCLISFPTDCIKEFSEIRDTLIPIESVILFISFCKPTIDGTNNSISMTSVCIGRCW